MTKFNAHKWIKDFKYGKLDEAEGKVKPFQPGLFFCLEAI